LDADFTAVAEDVPPPDDEAGCAELELPLELLPHALIRTAASSVGRRNLIEERTVKPLLTLWGSPEPCVSTVRPNPVSY
jgi:hypothetical protein